MPGGVGITVPHPITSPEDFSQRIPKSINVKSKLSHVIKAVELIKEELKGKVPLIGFSAAPWTLMFYLVGGSGKSKENQQTASFWLKNHPQESEAIFSLLTNIVVEYLSLQVEAGADVLQVFEAMGGFLEPGDFEKWALPSLRTIARELKARHPTVPLLVFPRGAGYSLLALQEAGYDVVSLDTHVDRVDIRGKLDNAFYQAAAVSVSVEDVEKGKEKGKVEGVGLGCRAVPAGVQGNLDVNLLILEKGKDGEEELAKKKKEVREAVKIMLEQLGTQNIIANLGEGLTGKESPSLVAEFIDAVHSISEEIINSGK
jgi:uroporphyrinogen decarboxylase